MSTAARDAAERLGLTYTAKGDRSLAEAFSHLPEVPRKCSTRHVMAGSLDGRAVTVLQPTYMVMAGSTPVQVTFTVYATEAPAWPTTHVSPRGLFGRLLLKLGRAPKLALDDPKFNYRFKLKADDEDFAITLLTPAMQRFMLEKPSVRWRIGHGLVCLVYAGTLKPARLEASLERVGRFWKTVEPELLHA